MQCPKCKGDMFPVTIDKVEVDQCQDCSGIWFDFDELRQTLEKGLSESLKNRIDNNEGHDVLEAPCPRCGGDGNMVPVVDPEHDLHIDTCTVCYGQWLDGGEYEKLKEKSFLDFLKAIL